MQNTVLVQKLYSSHWSKVCMRNTPVLDDFVENNRGDSKEDEKALNTESAGSPKITCEYCT